MGWLGSRRRNARHDTAVDPCSHVTVAGGCTFLGCTLLPRQRHENRERDEPGDTRRLKVTRVPSGV